MELLLYRLLHVQYKLDLWVHVQCARFLTSSLPDKHAHKYIHLFQIGLTKDCGRSHYTTALVFCRLTTYVTMKCVSDTDTATLLVTTIYITRNLTTLKSKYKT